jgi:EmrB/QacA subfamily drug resistance transporter
VHDARQLRGTKTNRKWWTLASVTVAMFMIMLDNTIVTVALPAIQRGIGATLSQLEWVVSAYALVFAVFLLFGGKIADFLGRRLIFQAGLVVFTLSSLWCGLSGSGGELIAARSVQGFGAAVMIPATLSIIAEAFEPHERGSAFGIWAGISSVALAIGPLVGGILVDYIHWSWIFFINVPVGAVGLAASFVFIAESRDTSADQSLDLTGLATSGGAMFLLVFALIEANSRGWGSLTIVLCFIGAAILFGAFVLIEHRGRVPMIDLSLFRGATFVGGLTCGLLILCALFAFIFFMSIYLQSIRGYSPVQAGSIFLFSTVALMSTAPIGGKLSDRIGGRLPIALGAGVFGVTLVVMSTLISTDVAIWKLFPWIFVGGLGYGLIQAPATTLVVGAVSPEKSGIASALMQTSRQLGGALGVAISGAIVAAYTASLSIRDPRYGPEFTSGLKASMLFAGATAIGVTALALTLIRKRPQVAPLGEGELPAVPPA